MNKPKLHTTTFREVTFQQLRNADFECKSKMIPVEKSVNDKIIAYKECACPCCPRVVHNAYYQRYHN